MSIKSLTAATCLLQLSLAATALFGQLTKTHTVGQLLDTYKDNGSLLFKDKVKKMQWRDHGVDGTSELLNFISGRGIWVGARDFTDQFSVPRPYFVTLGGFSSEDEGLPVLIERRVRYQKPTIAVNNGSGSITEALEPDVVVEPALVADESIVSQWKTPLGVTIKQTTFAFGMAGHDEYIVQEYVLKNTGDMNSQDGPEQSNALKDFWFGLTYMPDIGRTPFDDRYAYVGRGYVPNTDSVRAFYHWDGDHSAFLGYDQSKGAARTEPDDTGDPEPVDGSIRSQP